MSTTIRHAAARGHANHGWLDSHHTFSFANYYDPDHMGFGPLRVINEDRVAPGGGFSTHGHRDMEIVSYVVGGGLAHKDSMGNGSVIRPGDVQVMSAGTGVRHSEYNASDVDPVHFLQIWLMPEREGLTPRYEQKTFSDSDKHGQLRLIASRDAREGSLLVHQDADVFVTILSRGETVTHEISPGRRAWIQIVSGEVSVNGLDMSAGDGVAIEDETTVHIAARSDKAEAILFDLP